MSAATLAVEALTAGYGAREVIHDVSITAAGGTVISLLGANGAGKTSLLRAIIGSHVHKHAGTISLAGEDVTRSSVVSNVRAGISYVPEGGRVFPELSVAENLRLGAFTSKDAEAIKERERSVHALFPILEERRRQQADTLSGGQRQMLALGRALMADPKLLLLDEPFLGLAPVVIDDVCVAITQIARERGVAVVVAEQNARVLDLATHVYLMRLGRVVLDEPDPSLLLGEKADILQANLLA